MPLNVGPTNIDIIFQGSCNCFYPAM